MLSYDINNFSYVVRVDTIKLEFPTDVFCVNSSLTQCLLANTTKLMYVMMMM